MYVIFLFDDIFEIISMKKRRIALNLSIRELSSFQIAAHQLVDPFKGLNSFVCYKYQIKSLGSILVAPCSWIDLTLLSTILVRCSSHDLRYGILVRPNCDAFSGSAQDSAWFLWIEASQRTTQFLAAMVERPYCGIALPTSSNNLPIPFTRIPST